ncbi:MAG: HAD family hydrolase [Planctomycetota bacterium]
MILLFDIDGTLVADKGLDAELYRASVHEVLGPDVTIHEDWSRYVHVTDDGILREIAADHDVRFEDCVGPIRSAFERRVDACADRWGAVPGAVELLAALRSRADVSVGIATGGWQTTARRKLNCAGFELEDLPLAASDDSVERGKIMTICLERVRGERSSPEQAQERIVYVGDGTWDLEATARLGWEFLAVGEKLKGRHSAWVTDFSDPGTLETWPSALLPTTQAPS